MFFIIQSPLVWGDDFETLVPACQGVGLNSKNDSHSLSCPQAYYSDKLPKSLDDYQEVINHMSEDVFLNPDERFFMELKRSLGSKIKVNLQRMRTLHACTAGSRESINLEFRKMDFKPELIENSKAICDALLKGLRENIARNWQPMREGLELGFNSQVSSATRSGHLVVSSKTQLKYDNIPFKTGSKAHPIRGHLGRGFGDRIERPSRREQFGINELVFKEMAEIVTTTTWHQTSPAEIENTITRLQKDYPRQPEQKINALIKYLKQLPQHPVLGSGHQIFASKWSSSVLGGDRQSVKERYKAQYFKTLEIASPLLPYMKSSYPSMRNIREATELFIAQTQAFEERLRPDSENPILLKELANFLPSINELLVKNPQYCGYAKMWMQESMRQNQKKEMVRMAINVGAGAACVGSLFFAPSGAPLAVCGMALTPGLNEYVEDRNTARRMVGETQLNIDQLETTDFKELSAAQQQEAMSLALLALDTVGVVGDSGRLLIQTSKGLKASSAKKVMQQIKPKKKLEPKEVFTEIALGGELPNGGLLRAPNFSANIKINSDPALIKTQSEEIARTLRRSRSEINKLSPQKIYESPANLSSLKNNVMANIDDEELARGFSEAFDRMHDANYLEDYTRKLKADVFASMLSSGDEKIMAMAQRGEIHRSTMQQVLEARASARGQNITVIKDLVDDRQFREYIGRGAVIDEGFSAGSNHGIWTHMVQQDMTYDVILESSGKSVRELEDFWKTPAGFEVWREMYDGFSSNTTNPENFGRRFVQPVLNLTFIPRRDVWVG